MKSNNDVLSISGFIEIQDKDGNIIYEGQNSLLPWGKYKILTSIFATRNENIDGIKYLELCESSMKDFNSLAEYNNVEVVKRIQIDRRAGISFMQFYDNQWVSMGPALNLYNYQPTPYRRKYLQEQFTVPQMDQLQYSNIFNWDQLRYDKIMAQVSIPIIKQYDDDSYIFNTLILTYGGKDADVALVEEDIGIVNDPSISNTDPTDLTSGVPFSIVTLPEDIEVKDSIYLFWKFMFSFNQKYLV